MGGFFGAVSDRDVALDVFFGTDYHSHLGTRRGGMVLFDKKEGFQRQIHNIENTPFRTKFERDLADFRGHAGLGCISDSDPQPLLVRSHLGLVRHRDGRHHQQHRRAGEGLSLPTRASNF